ncbi:hypothetical protein [Streptomyces virginiae]|uniref:hypothetical protein n=1 Tax=Streptomyces virginiae TaxID=1961 RepID=UPI002DB765ED|nr:hypothetical protein [Streptomyces sp. CMAA1738]MEC4576519.1 hypothetical protein [Streptomyces sp. CMAA1738]
MDTVTALASAAFGSTVYLVTLSTAKWLNQISRGLKMAGLIMVGVILCAVIGTIAVAGQSVVVGFIVGAGLTPPIHRWILQRRNHAASS